MSRSVLFTFILLLFTFNGRGQSTSSPYSLFGLGQAENFGTGTNHAMGGCGIGLKSHSALNMINPASYSGIDSLSFLFEAGLFGRITYYTSGSETQKRHDANLRYLAMGCRINKWWATGFGFMPFSSVGYIINTTDYVEGELSAYSKIYEGTGGINRFYWGNSLRLMKNLSLGVNLSYYLGSIEHTETGTTADKEITYLIDESYKLHTAQLDYGIQYTLHSDDIQLTFGAIYSEQKKISSLSDAYICYESDTIPLESKKEHFKLPRRYGVGMAFELRNHVKAAFDYEKTEWQKTQSFTNTSLRIRDGERYSAGIEYTPYSGYKDQGLKRMFYRLGASYNKSYMIIDKIPLNSYSIVVGVGIPLHRELSMVNISFELGQTGTTRHSLIQENYLLMHLNFTLHDIWFIRHPIN
jgi:hypothetical protein